MGTAINASLIGNAGRTVLYASAFMEKLNTEAVFSDETAGFVIPCEPSPEDEVEILIRTESGNADSVALCYNGVLKYMELKRTEGFFDYYSITLPPSASTLRYYFEIKKGGRLYYYTKIGVSKDAPVYEGLFRLIRGFKTPDWAKGAVMYQIFADRFCNGDADNDVVDNEYIYLGRPSVAVKDWNTKPAADDIRNFYGGDLAGIISKLDYLQGLGVNVIYLNPIFVSPSNHKYDIQDYDYVDPHLGVIVEDGGNPLEFEKFNNRHATMYIQRTTSKINLEASNRLFIKLVRLSHERGMKVILDGVFNHCGAFNKWLDREGFYSNSGKYPPGAYKEAHSPYHSFFKWYDMDNWPNNDCYDGWWGYDNHPKLNFEASPELYNYILEVGAKWVSPPFNADGWRLDVAADLGYSEEFNHRFWKDFRKAVKSANPEAIILAEHYGVAEAWLQGDQWDTIMNYDAFMEPLTWFLTGMEKHSEEFRPDLLSNGRVFRDAMLYNMARLSYQSVYTAMNELSNHDHSRFLTRTNMTAGRLHTHGSEAAEQNLNYGIMREAVAIQMTWPGSPTIYYGDEAGVCGWTDPDNRRTYPWGNENKDLLEFHRAAVKIHNDNGSILRFGSLKMLITDYGALVFGRFNSDGAIITAVNNTDSEKEMLAPVWQLGLDFDCTVASLLSSDRDGFSTSQKTYTVSGGVLKIKLPAYGSIILKG